MTRRLLNIVLFCLLLLAPACYTVGFHPVEAPIMVGEPFPKSVSLFVEPEVSDATYSFRAMGSGILNKWTVPYGQRIHEYARVYLTSAFGGFQEVQTAGDMGGGDVLVKIDSATYEVSGQAAHVDMHVVAVDGSGATILEQNYKQSGSGKHGQVIGGGAFSQKEATRSSTNEALSKIFAQLIVDLKNKL